MKQSQFLVTSPVEDGVLLFNTLNSALVHLSREEYSQIKNISNDNYAFNSEQMEFLERLKELGILVERENEFLKLVEQYWEFRNSEEYIKVVVAPTTKCNFACPYCFERGAVQKDMDSITAQRIIKIIQEKLKEGKSKRLALIWYGGEPFLKWDIVYKMTSILFDWCHNFGVDFMADIVTNGFLITPDIVNKLKNVGCKLIQITLDGNVQYHNAKRFLKNGLGTFETIYENICLCCKEINTTVRVNIDKSNVQSVRSLIDRFSMDQYFDVELFFAPVEPFYDSDKELCYSPEKFAEVQVSLIEYAVERGLKRCICLPTPKFGFCEAVSEHNLLFDPDGDHFLCWENVGKKELTSCSKSDPEVFSTLYNYFVRTYSFHKEECTKCSIFPLCLGGCPQRKLESGNAQCPVLFYNIEDMIRIYYETFMHQCSKE